MDKNYYILKIKCIYTGIYMKNTNATKTQSLKLRRMICIGGYGMNLLYCGHSPEMSPCDKAIKPSGPIKDRKFND